MGAGRRDADSDDCGAVGAGGVSESLSIPDSSVMHRCLFGRRWSLDPIGDCGGEGKLRFLERVWSSVLRRCRFTRESESYSSTGNGDSERGNIAGSLRFRVGDLYQGCSCAGKAQ